MEAGDGVSHLTEAGNPYADAFFRRSRKTLFSSNYVFPGPPEPVLPLAISTLYGRTRNRIPWQAVTSLTRRRTWRLVGAEHQRHSPSAISRAIIALAFSMTSSPLVSIC